MDLNNFGKNKSFSSLCSQDPWYFFLPSSHRLKCCLNVTLERKGRDDVSTSYNWESSEVDWWLATNLDKIQLNEVGFRLKLLSWRHRNPFLRSGMETQDFNYHWTRPGFDVTENDYSEDDKMLPTKSPSIKYLQEKFNSNVVILISIAVLILVVLVFSPSRP